jgi:hypothetical protein
MANIFASVYQHKTAVQLPLKKGKGALLWDENIKNTLMQSFVVG